MRRSNGELKSMARQMLLGRYQVPMLAMILSTLIPSLFLLPFNYLCSERNAIPLQAVMYYLAYFIIVLIELLLSCGVNRIHLLISRGQTAAVSDMFWVFKNRPDRILIGGFLYTLVSWIPLIPSFVFDRMAPEGLSETSAWMISELLWLFGMLLGFLLTLPVYFIFWLYADDANIDTAEALRSSIALMRGAKWRFCLMELSFIGWMILGALSFGIGFLWILPYMSQSHTNFYLETKHAFDATVELSEDAQTYIQQS